MMIISHRGNLTGPNPERENTVEAIEEALNKGFPVEIDVWYREGKYWLGHDEPQYETNADQLYEWSDINKLYIHCKNVWAMQKLLEDGMYHDLNVNMFFHHDDQCILLPDSSIWVHPLWVTSVDEKMADDCIAVLPNRKKSGYNEDDGVNIDLWKGVCTDYPEDLRNSL